MKEIPVNEFEEIVKGNSENLNLEFKGTFNFDTDIWARERLIRAILAMSNTRVGGDIIIGIEEKSDKSGYDFNGVKQEHLLLFRSREEDLKAKIESFCAFSVSYEIGISEYVNNKFIVIRVTEFSLYPSICRKNGEHKDKFLEEGAIYIRTLKDKPSSIKLTNPVDIQDFIERATDKQILNLHKRGWKHEVEDSKNNKSLFEKERTNF